LRKYCTKHKHSIENHIGYCPYCAIEELQSTAINTTEKELEEPTGLQGANRMWALSYGKEKYEVPQHTSSPKLNWGKYTWEIHHVDILRHAAVLHCNVRESEFTPEMYADNVNRRQKLRIVHEDEGYIFTGYITACKAYPSSDVLVLEFDIIYETMFMHECGIIEEPDCILDYYGELVVAALLHQCNSPNMFEKTKEDYLSTVD